MRSMHIAQKMEVEKSAAQENEQKSTDTMNFKLTKHAQYLREYSIQQNIIKDTSRVLKHLRDLDAILSAEQILLVASKWNIYISLALSVCKL